jgi:O-antigen ligase
MGKKLAKLLPIALILYLLFSMLSITVSQIFIAVALITWFILFFQKRQSFHFPNFFWVLLAYAALSLIASFFSDNPAISLKDSRELLLFLIVPLTYTGFQKQGEIKTANLALLGSAYLSIVFSFIYFLVKASPGERISGFMGHYMTQAGLLLLFSALALSMFFFTRDKIRFIWGTGFALAAIALILTLTRNAWIGIVIVAFVILLIYKPRALIAIPIAIALFIFLSPQHVKRRALSIFDTKSYSNAQRIEYIKAGLKIIKDYPIVGTGPNTVHVIFQKPKYELSEEARSNVHLHNNLIQIAAERGIFSLLVWLAFMVWVFYSLVKLLKNKDPTLLPLTTAALAALLALNAAGLFEYNFGDSEITTLFLYLITIPFALQRIQKNQDLQ